MIVYAFYGMGKSTLCSKNPDIFMDVDYEMYKFEPHELTYRDYVLKESKKRKIVFVNCPFDVLDNKDIAIAFLPSDIDYIAKRLIERGTNQGFVDNIVGYKDEILKELNDLCNKWNNK